MFMSGILQKSRHKSSKGFLALLHRTTRWLNAWLLFCMDSTSSTPSSLCSWQSPLKHREVGAMNWENFLCATISKGNGSVWLFNPPSEWINWRTQCLGRILLLAEAFCQTSLHTLHRWIECHTNFGFNPCKWATRGTKSDGKTFAQGFTSPEG